MEHFYKQIEGWFDFQNLYSEMVERYPSGSHFVEIGAWFGCSTSYMAVEIANSGKLIWFDAIDTWQGSVNEPMHQDVINQYNGSIYDKFLDNMKNVLQYVKPICMTSEQASSFYKDGSLDFIFVDADHSYEAVTKDLQNWFPKLKAGGIIAGHDWPWDSVRNAVTDFFKIDLPINISSWVYQK